MSYLIPINNSTPEYFEKYIPLLTLITCLICIILFIGINIEENLDDWDVYRRWGSPSIYDIFNGSYWGVITSNFLHIQIWHISINLFWIWYFGKKIEFESSKEFYIIFILSSCFVSSIAQLSFSDTTGIGISGVLYSFFGYLVVKKRTSKAYKSYLKKELEYLMIFSLFMGLYINGNSVVDIGNAAHFGGFIWGVLIAYISKFDISKQLIVAFIFNFILTSSIFWNPFSTALLTYKAYELHENQEFDKAIIAYEKIIDRDPNNENAKLNLKNLNIHKLSEKAYELHENKEYNEARRVYLQILILDEGNEWASENLKSLPTE